MWGQPGRDAHTRCFLAWKLAALHWVPASPSGRQGQQQFPSWVAWCETLNSQTQLQVYNGYWEIRPYAGQLVALSLYSRGTDSPGKAQDFQRFLVSVEWVPMLPGDIWGSLYQESAHFSRLSPYSMVQLCCVIPRSVPPPPAPHTFIPQRLPPIAFLCSLSTPSGTLKTPFLFLPRR